MLRFLTGPAKYANTPKLLGSVEYIERNGSQRALAILQEFVRTQGDGWSHALDYVNRVFDGLRDVGRVDTASTDERHAAYLEQIRVLGCRVAELHRALAIETDDPAFKAEPLAAADMAAWRDNAIRLAKAAFDDLHKAASNGDPAGSQAQALLERRTECLDRIQSLSAKPVTAMKTRTHGDLHLGQVLVVKNDFHIIDFEGEPARDLEGRRAKTSPLRDIAGMLRSIHYAAWAALFGLRDRDPDGFEKLLPYAMEWRAAVQNTFLTAYSEAINGCPSWPTDACDSRRLLNLFVLEKVLYEIHYEATNRPGWLRIPVAGLGEVLDALGTRMEDTLAAA